ncbi:hypothetical protein F0562_023069 [Nyssa sinensis]|uniref:non-specific serine/threonine protein kinase n=1 Tax=Nyssa sinensis TaxID=561372 RepID=A0A5J5BJD2_9ASTE|nr:hypothetical protein F0562_023069 [Nyssa sinensis]
MSNDSRKTVNQVNGKISSASLVANSWNFYDQNQALVWQFNFTEHDDTNATWAAILGTDGSISFHNLQSGRSAIADPIKIPQNSCSTPEPCDPYSVCSFDNRCQCPSALNSVPNCKPQTNLTCNSSKSSTELLQIGEKLDYFALGFVTPVLKTNLNGCTEACLSSCSCIVLFFDNSSGSCFLFDRIGSLRRADLASSGFVSYIKVSSDVVGGLNPKGEKTRDGGKPVLVILIIAVATVLTIVGLLYLGIRFHRTRKKTLESSQDFSEEDNFFDGVSGMPVRFSYNDLRDATKNFCVKLGQGGFGSVYQGMLPDGTQVAVKKLEGIGQGKKEFRAEVSIIGSIHHVHLVKLRGFCAEGSHRLLVYEYMGNGSLDRWIFRKNREGHVLDWETRFNIALGTAKGLAYLHEECDVKIVHCDIKPENVLLDDNFLAKVSDFGLAKLMGREESQVYTAVRGTRGYLAPEWITSYAISEKSDVYSFGMVLLEIIGGRKNFNPGESSEKAHFPSYAFKMMEEGKLEDILDLELKIDENDESAINAIKVALWCIQDDMYLRPPMTRVVQMLEGLCAVPEPPVSSQMNSRLYSGFFKSSSEEGTFSGLTNYNSDALLSNVRASTQYIGQIYPGFEESQMNWDDHNGMFLLSNNSVFALGFGRGLDVTLFVLVIVHLDSGTVVWTANRQLLLKDSAKFVFDKNGNVYLRNATSVVWSTDTSGKGVTAMELQGTGNLVVLDHNRRILWQSFSHPTDTLLSGQKFVEGMKLKSFPYHNYFHYMQIKSGDLIMYAGYQTPQVYWSMSNDSRKTVNQVNGKVSSASLVANSWNFYDQNQALVWQFNFTEHDDTNATWAAILGTDGSISFHNLQRGRSAIAEAIKIPQNSCSTPEPCDPYSVCSFDNRCQCPSALNSVPNCKPQTNLTCNSSKSSIELLKIGEKLDYFALGFVTPVLKTNLNGCTEACLSNCSCIVLFFDNSSGSCFLFDRIGSLRRADLASSGFVSYIKVSSDVVGGLNPKGEKTRDGGKPVLVILIIAVPTVLTIVGLLYLGIRFHRTRKKTLESSQEFSEEDNFFDSVSGMPVRFSYNDLRDATTNFSVKLGQGGFGSVYQGKLPDGTQVAVKKLEGIGQGKKEFRAEVSIIGSIHHVHLVKLRGFCAEGSHRLLVYEYMGNGSLDRWIFRKNREGHVLDWETRFNIALGTAKGLAYLHEECDVKIVHCDIKPENVLLDDNFLAKVSDFGLAKLMGREESQVYTAVRGTRGYLAPEWISSYAISEKSDVYSFGMVLLEIIGGRKNFNPGESSEKAHFPSYAFKMMEEGKLEDILDLELKIDENDESAINAIKVALWCIQYDVYLRPPMTKVVQMLEGLCAVPEPPISSQMSSRLHSGFFKSSSEEGTFSGLTNYNSDALLSNVRLSGPR